MTILGNIVGRATLLRDRRSITLGTLLERLAAIQGDAVLATEPSGTSLTYAEAARLVAAWGGAIRAGIEPGDRVVVAAANDYRFLLLCLAAARAGGVVVPVNPQMTAGEVDHVIADSGATFVVRDADELAAAAPASAAPADPGAVGAIFYTSGTTGKPKGARLTHAALVGQAVSGVAWPSGLRRDEAVVGLPVAHIMGFSVLLSLAAAGIPVHFLGRFKANAALDAIETRRATVFVGVPAMYRMLLESGAEDRDLRSVRVWASGADVMPDDIARRFQRMGATARLPIVGDVGQALFVEGYGMVEVGGGVAGKVSPPYVDLPFGDALGFSLPGYRMKVMDDNARQVLLGQVGELWVRGPGVLQGYHGDAAATRDVVTPDGWLRTGDLARRGPLGTVSFVGRKKDVIKHGGYSVYAVEVQAALEEHPAVAEAAVIALPDERKGEVPVGVVRLLPGAAASEGELLAWAKEHLSAYKVPRQVKVVEELPRTGTDKVQKARLRELFS